MTFKADTSLSGGMYIKGCVDRSIPTLLLVVVVVAGCW